MGQQLLRKYEGQSHIELVSAINSFEIAIGIGIGIDKPAKRKADPDFDPEFLLAIALQK